MVALGLVDVGWRTLVGLRTCRWQSATLRWRRRFSLPVEELALIGVTALAQ